MKSLCHRWCPLADFYARIHLMIEDDDSFRQKEGLDHRNEEDSSRSRSLVVCSAVLIIWILWSFFCFLFFREKIITAIVDSGVIALIQEMNDEEEPLSTRNVELIYPFYDGSTVMVRLRAERHGSDIYHDTVEALINEYAYEAYALGAVNLVSSECSLIGLTACEGICYVDLSREILDSPSLEGYTAFNQIEDTLMLFDDIEKVEFLIEGEKLDPDNTQSRKT